MESYETSTEAIMFREYLFGVDHQRDKKKGEINGRCSIWCDVTRSEVYGEKIVS